MTTTRPRLVLPRLVAVLRAGSGDRLPAICEVLYAEGFRAFEFTFTTPDAMKALETTRKRLPDDAIFGAGTVLTVEEVHTAADAGARFAVSPVHLPVVLESAIASGLPFIPGTTTPTEAYSAWQAGAAMVKIWPAGPVGGPGYVQAILQVLPELLLMPSGGITVEDVSSYLAAGAATLGLGGGFIGDVTASRGDLDALAARARRAVAAARHP
jgi:2-dehydro-3-deoxyphosphogluconate aldolase/(4S)-4-hydroxy-2-oxoglutarate aldolase